MEEETTVITEEQQDFYVQGFNQGVASSIAMMRELLGIMETAQLQVGEAEQED